MKRKQAEFIGNMEDSHTSILDIIIMKKEKFPRKSNQVTLSYSNLIWLMVIIILIINNDAYKLLVHVNDTKYYLKKIEYANL